ncbi:MAG: nucleotidyltransferase domain-containing protein [Gammaproteobacteria bacterium]
MRTIKRDDLSKFRQSIALAIEATGLKMIAVYLHGSFGTEYMRADSDIDLAFLSERPLALEKSMSFSAELQKACREDNLDIADLHRCDTVFVAHVVSSGERIYTGDETAAQRFEMTALSKYARLNEERAEIISAIKQRGSVFGAEARPT